MALAAGYAATRGQHRYVNRNGAPLFSFLRKVVVNLLRNGGYRSVNSGQQQLNHDIKAMLAHGGVAMSTICNDFSRP